MRTSGLNTSNYDSSKKLRQASFDIIIESERSDEWILKTLESAIKSTLFNIIKARSGISEVKYYLTSEGPRYLPLSEIERLEKEKNNGPTSTTDSTV